MKILRLISVFPYLVGFLVPGVILPRGSVAEVSLLIKQYTVFLILFLVWALTSLLVEQGLFSATKAVAWSGRIKNFLKFTLFIILALAFLLLINSLRQSVDQNLFLIVIATITSFGLRSFYTRRGSYILSLVVLVIALTGVGFTSFSILMAGITWQPLVFALGLSSLVSATLAAQDLGPQSETNKSTPLGKSGRSGSGATQDRKVISRTISVLMLVGPSLLAALCYFRELPAAYLALLITVYFSSLSITSLRAWESSGKLPQNFAQQATGNCLIFVVIIQLLALEPSLLHF